MSIETKRSRPVSKAGVRKDNRQLHVHTHRVEFGYHLDAFLIVSDFATRGMLLAEPVYPSKQ